MKTKLLHYLKVWVPLAVVATLMSGLVYLTVQQSFRSGANDPQIQISEDISVALANGAQATQLNQSNKVDIAKSLASYIIIYDDQGNPVASTGVLDNGVPKPPSGVFDYVRSHGEDRITWQPKSGVRSAIVVRQYTAGNTSGFILVGRSLREVEKRTAVLGWHVLAGWLSSLFIILGALAANDMLFGWLTKPKAHSEPEHSGNEKSVDL